MDKETQQRHVAALDRASLLGLRPGMPVQRLKDVFGALWVPRKPKDKGWFFDFSEASFTARLDRNDVIAKVTYFRMPAEWVVDGLRSGMSTAEALRVHPALALQPMNNEHGYVDYREEQADGSMLMVRFSKEDALVSLSFERLGAEYPGEEYVPAAPGRYPAAEATPGLPFADGNLKLAVMDEMLDAGVLDLGSPEELAEFVMQRRVDLEEEGYEMIEPAYDYLVRYPLTQAQLDAVTKLEFDGGLEIYRYAWYFWDGESDEFDIHSFQGIEACRNLRSVNHISMVASEAEAALEALEVSLQG